MERSAPAVLAPSRFRRDATAPPPEWPPPHAADIALRSADGAAEALRFTRVRFGFPFTDAQSTEYRYLLPQ